MRKLLFKALGLYGSLGRGLRRLRGTSDEDEATRRLLSGQSWAEFCDALKAAGAAVCGPGAPQGALDQAEGYRYLTRLLRGGLETLLEHADPLAPVLRLTAHETIKLGADSPDNRYWSAVVSGAHEYRVRGRRGSVHLLTFSTQKGGYGQGGGLPPSGFLDSKQLQLAPDGSFEVILSCREQPGNWLRMEPDTGMLMVRQTFLDRAREVPAELVLERIDGDGLPAPLTPAMVDAGLRGAVNLVAGASMLFLKWTREFQRHTNELPLFDPDRSTAAGGDPQIAYYHSYWRLAPDEALVVEVTPPECESWNFQLDNYWMESMDYRYFKIHVNKHTARYEPDGSVRIIVAHQDPGVPNWINTTGHEHGTMLFRWIRAKEWRQPRTSVVKLASLRPARG